MRKQECAISENKTGLIWYFLGYIVIFSVRYMKWDLPVITIKFLSLILSLKDWKATDIQITGLDSHTSPWYSLLIDLLVQSTGFMQLDTIMSIFFLFWPLCFKLNQLKISCHPRKSLATLSIRTWYHYSTSLQSDKDTHFQALNLRNINVIFIFYVSLACLLILSWISRPKEKLRGVRNVRMAYKTEIPSWGPGGYTVPRSEIQ